MKNQLAFGAVAFALVASPVLAQEQQAESDLGRALSRMASASGEEYLAARAQVLAAKDARSQLEARLEGASWNDRTFPQLAMATIALAHVANPEVVAKVNRLDGVNAEKYLLRRRPDPECARELRNLCQQNPATVGAILEVYLKTFDRYPFTNLASPSEAARKSGRLEKLPTMERLALREGIVMAISETKHASAFFVCRAVARDKAENEGVRNQALENLGNVGTAEALEVMKGLHADETSPAGLRLAAIRGAASIPSAEALSFLSKRLAEGETVERKSAAVALGTFGSAWAWESRGAAAAELGDQLRREASAKLVAALGKDAELLGDAAIDSIAVIAHPATRALLEKSDSPLARRALERLDIALERNGTK